MVTTDRRMAGAASPRMLRKFTMGLVVRQGGMGPASAATAGRLAG
jgi:hypothetical protein